MKFASVTELEPEGVLNPEIELQVASARAAHPQTEHAPPGKHSDTGNNSNSLFTLLILCLLRAVGGANMLLLPASTLALRQDVGLRLNDITLLNMIQTLVTSVSSPIWGSLADRKLLTTRQILVFACMGQGVSVILLAFVTPMGPMLALRCLNGLFVAPIHAIPNSIAMDLYPDYCRGSAFGFLKGSYLFGSLVTHLAAGNDINTDMDSFQGWRLALISFGAIAACTGIFVQFVLVEPESRQQIHKQQSSSTCCHSVLSELQRTCHLFKIPTFGIIVLQGIAGSIPWLILNTMVTYFHLCGLEDGMEFLLYITFAASCTVGVMLGGFIGDALSHKLGLCGRPLCAQISVGIGLLVSYVLFAAIPVGKGTAAEYISLVGVLGLLASWAESGTNLPILSLIAAKEDRTKALALPFAIDHAISCAVSHLYFSEAAERLFGYSAAALDDGTASIKLAAVYGKAMILIICCCWIFSLAVYTFVYWTLPRDVKRISDHD